MRNVLYLALLVVAGAGYYVSQQGVAPAAAALPAEAPPAATAPPPPPVAALPACAQALSKAARAATDLEAAGDVEAAIGKLRTARFLEPERSCSRQEHPWARHTDLELIRLLLQKSIAESDAGRLAAAIRYASEAEAVGLDDDEQAVLAVKIRLGNLLAQRADEADTNSRRRELAEEALEVKADHPRALYVLAKACEELNDLPCALDAAKRLKAARPETSGIDALVEKLERQTRVEGAFLDVSSAHFVARYEGGTSATLGWAAVSALERAYFRIGDKLDLRPDSPITVVVYSGEQYKKATLAPDWSGGIFDGKIRLPEAGLLDQAGVLEDVLAHEYTHALLARTVKGTVPTWVHEGLAQSMEQRRDAGRAVDVVRRAGRILPLSVLEGSFLGISDREVVQLAYAQSHAMVQKLLDWQGPHGLARLFDAMNQGEAFAAAFQRVYLRTPAAFLEEWAADVR